MRSSSVRCSLTDASVSVSPARRALVPRARLRRRYAPFRSPSGGFTPSSSGASRDPPGAPLVLAARAGSPPRVLPYRRPRLPSEAWSTPSGSGPRGCAGACAAPGCGRRSSALTAVDGALIALLPPYEGAPPGADRRRAAGGLRQPRRGRRARRRSPGARCGAGGRTCRASSRTTTRARRWCSRSRSACSRPGSRTGRRPPPSAATRPRCSTRCSGFVTAQAAEWQPGLTASTRCGSRPRSTARACRATTRAAGSA